MEKKIISGWGRNKFIETENFFFSKENFNKAHDFITRGNGNSYGDTSLNKNIISFTKKKKILFFDKKRGIVKTEPGISIGELLEVTIKNNWILSVIPGAKNVTIGGAIANDVHGKNHFNSGCFSEYIKEFTILTAKMGVLNCSKTKNSELFKLTCGGLGLSGIITSVTISLRRTKSLFLVTKTIKCKSLKEMLIIFKKHNKSDYLVGWYDFFSKKDKFLITTANHTDKFIADIKDQKPLKLCLPSFFLNKFTIKIFNFFYFLLNKSNSKLVYYKKFFFPLDKFINWNKLYGNKGFYQYQFVIPEINSESNLKKIINVIKKSKFRPYLTVVKMMGRCNSNYLSFPIKGYSFALDFKNEINVIKLFDKLDKIIIKMNGRIYLAKDSSIKKDNFFKMYPKINDFKKILSKYSPSGKITSLQSSRLGITQS
jgi:hypothetical protein